MAVEVIAGRYRVDFLKACVWRLQVFIRRLSVQADQIDPITSGV